MQKGTLISCRVANSLIVSHPEIIIWSVKWLPIFTQLMGTQFQIPPMVVPRRAAMIAGAGQALTSGLDCSLTWSESQFDAFLLIIQLSKSWINFVIVRHAESVRHFSLEGRIFALSVCECRSIFLESIRLPYTHFILVFWKTLLSQFSRLNNKSCILKICLHLGVSLCLSISNDLFKWFLLSVMDLLVGNIQIHHQGLTLGLNYRIDGVQI